MKALTKPKAGDLFYIPAVNKDDEIGFIIARYIELIEPNLGHLIEVFEKFYTEIPTSIDEVDTTRRLFRPIFCSLRFSSLPRWKILFSDPDYEKSMSGYGKIKFAFDSSLWVGGKSLSATESQLEGIEPSICWRMDHIVFRVIAHLKGALDPDDIMDYEKLPEDLREDSDIASERVEKAARIMNEKFESHKKTSKP